MGIYISTGWGTGQVSQLNSSQNYAVIVIMLSFTEDASCDSQPGDIQIVHCIAGGYCLTCPVILTSCENRDNFSVPSTTHVRLLQTNALCMFCIGQLVPRMNFLCNVWLDILFLSKRGGIWYVCILTWLPNWLMCLLCMDRYMLSLCYFRVDKKRDKQEKKILDSQERAFWDLHRPAVSILNDIHVFVSK